MKKKVINKSGDTHIKWIDENGVKREKEIVSKEESKYYTPTIDEFHVGFEYEKNMGKLMKTDKFSWDKFEFLGRDSIMTTFKLAEELGGIKHYIRVKHLDREDIESLGWEHYNGLIYRKGNYEILHNFQRKLKYSITVRELFGDKWFDLAVFPAKNKSVLKRVLKMIGV